MATIQEVLEEKLIARMQQRLRELRAMNAPMAMLKGIEGRLAKGSILDQVGHIQEFGPLEFINATNKMYRRGAGVEFDLLDGRKVWLIPGPYGLFLTDKKKGEPR